MGGVEAVYQACLEQGVHPGGLVQLFLRSSAEVRSRWTVLPSVLEPICQSRDGLDRDLAKSVVDLLEDLEREA